MKPPRQPAAVRHLDAKPTGRQIYALAHELCQRSGERFPSTRAEASELIERLRGRAGRDTTM